MLDEHRRGWTVALSSRRRLRQIVFQIGTAKYGVRDENGDLCDDRLRAMAAHDEVKMFEVKLSQGAKPGKGGILPGTKVTEEIAKIRGIPARQDSISPNRHRDIDSVDDLLDMTARVREVTGRPVGFKSVVGAYGWLEALCEAIHARGIESAPDFITVDSGDGGTGAAPMPLMDNVGLPVKEALPVVVDILIRYGLARTHQGDRLRQADHPGRSRMGILRGRRLRRFRTRLHVRSRLHPGAKVQQEYLSDRHHDARSPPTARPRPGGQINTGKEFRRKATVRHRDHRPFLWRCTPARP